MNYLKTAWRVLLRRKFFTFVSLFCIAITLGVLTTVVTMLDNLVHPRGAEKNSEQYLAVTRLTAVSKDGNSTWSSSPGYRFVMDYMTEMKTPKAMSVFSESRSGAMFKDGQKQSYDMRWTDDQYWQILDFDFIEGRPISATDHQQGSFVAVINEEVRDAVYGGSAVGQNLTISGQTFEVIGVVKNESRINGLAYSQIWVPILTSPSSQFRKELISGFSVLLEGESKADLQVIKNEYIEVLKGFEYPENPEQYYTLWSGADSKLEQLARETIGPERSYESGADRLLGIVIGGMLLFMVLPAVNLINLNVSRIMERSSEIGVRKAFGASSWRLVGQFVIENLVLTLLGGILGFLLALMFLYMIELSGLISYFNFHINLRVFAAALALVLVFGILSGVYPAWRMSRMDPVQALKGV